MTNKRPTIGLALRGASSRSVFYIGFLEVLHEQGLPVDYIAAMSGGAIVAAAYACGTLNQLREQALSLNTELLASLIERSASKSGVYNLDKVEELLRVYTHNQKFEEVHPLMGFVAADINKGEEVVLSMGDIAHAARASCTLPWVFEPVPWGNRMLVDGGLMSIIPGEVVRQAGIDIVIGIDLRNKDYIFGRPQIFLKRIANFIKRLLLVNQAERLWQHFTKYLTEIDFFNQYDLSNASVVDYPGKYEILGRSMDLALSAEKKHGDDSSYGCDIVIKPTLRHLRGWKRFVLLDLIDFSHTKELYELGRQTAEEHLPGIWQMMADTEKKQVINEKQLEKIVEQNDGLN